MNQIRVKKKDVYTIEVNDKGDVIEFDITDIGLPFALERACKMVEEAEKYLRGRLVVAQKQQNTVKKGEFMTTREKETLVAYREFFRRVRAAIDEFAGAGASDKIFGGQNYVNMFNDFMTEMQPHFEAMGVKSMDVKKAIEEKYGTEDTDEL